MSLLARRMSAFGGKADIEPLITNLDLWVHHLPPGGTKIICTNENRQRGPDFLSLNVHIF